MTISERTFIQKNTESNITNCKFLQSNQYYYYLASYFESNILRNLVTK